MQRWRLEERNVRGKDKSNSSVKLEGNRRPWKTKVGREHEMLLLEEKDKFKGFGKEEM